MSQPSRYLTILAGTILTLALATVVVGYIADPYRFFGSKPIGGWTALKPRAYEQADLAKTYMLARVRPATLLLGNSRIEVGFNPNSAAWPAELKPVFNAGLAGHDLVSALLFLQHDLAFAKPRLVIVGLDFQDFIQSETNKSVEPPVTDAERRKLRDRGGKPNDTRTIQLLRDAITSTLTIDSAVDSVVTLLRQNPSGTDMTDAGFNPLSEYKSIIRDEGAHSLFAQKSADYYAQYRAFARSNFAYPEKNLEFHLLTAILRTCRDHGVPVVFVTYPYHAYYLNMLHRLGLWPSFISWKHVLRAQIVAAARVQAVQLLDFTDFAPFNSEQVPGPSDLHSEMRWYWEEGHFKSALGDLLIERIVRAWEMRAPALDRSESRAQSLPATASCCRDKD